MPIAGKIRIAACVSGIAAEKIGTAAEILGFEAEIFGTAEEIFGTAEEIFGTAEEKFAIAERVFGVAVEVCGNGAVRGEGEPVGETPTPLEAVIHVLPSAVRAERRFRHDVAEPCMVGRGP